MAKANPQETWARRCGRFLWRHKILSTFGLLVLVLAALFCGWTISWDRQVAHEREQFLQTKQTLYAWAPELSAVVGAPVQKKSDCTYTGDGSVFAHRNLGCGTEVVFSRSVSGMPEAKMLNQEVRNFFPKYGIRGTANPGGKDKYDIDIYTFDLNRIGCAYVTSYFDTTVPASSRYEGVSLTGNEFYMIANCAGSAKEPYFPATN